MTNITEDYVSFETAKLLKENGFDENTPVNYFVGDDKPRGCVVGEMIYHKRAEGDTHLIACPTIKMAMKWLREAHHIFLSIQQHMDMSYVWYSYVDGAAKGCDRESHNNTYEEACEAAIKYCLENLI